MKAVSVTSILSKMGPVIAAALALLVGAVVLVASGADPILAYQAIIMGAFGTQFNAAETLRLTGPLLFVGLAVTLAFKCKFWNIGAEGQLYMGAIFGVFAAFAFRGLPSIVLVPLVFIFSFVGGAAWGLIPALLKIKANANEIITTLMLNYIAIYFTSYLVYGPWRDTTYPVAVSAVIPPESWFPILVKGTRIHVGILIAFLGVIAVAILFRTSLGYDIRAIGVNQKAARYGGINIDKVFLVVMFISGGLAGLAGIGEVSGNLHRLYEEISVSYGFFGIAVALLGKLNPIAVAFAAVLFAALMNGADAMQRAAHVNVMMVYIIEGLIVIFVLTSEYLTARWK